MAWYSPLRIDDLA
ncbi:hypothetical protein F383_20252 [Gossypium arboreum]|uniref:Uncharacterized protein n=1 Tax=Gossypium arboreum TaxID=29729 RepID=A0A0B0NKB0_GOSAR|nr:hypothetical protein F383_20252 [Gossypium arboreum]